MMFSVAALNAVIIASRIWSISGIESSSSKSSNVSCPSDSSGVAIFLIARKNVESSQIRSSSVSQPYSASDTVG